MGWGKLFILLMLLVPAVAFAESPATAPANRNAVIIHIDGQINDYTRDTLEKRLAEARRLKAGTVILDIDTYGGTVKAGLEMSALLKRTTDLHTIAYVKEKAISAGAMIAVAADEIVMGPFAKLGDCAPIMVEPGGGIQPMGPAERDKQESPIRLDFRESAERNGYDPLLLESMVTIGRVVYWVQNLSTAERKFVNQADYDKLTATGNWFPVPGVPNPVDGANELLTVNTDLAVKLGLSKGTAVDYQTLAGERGLTITADLATGAGEQVLGWLNSAGVRFFLIVIFLLSLYIAFHSPGMGGAEAAAAASLATLIIVPLLTGYAQWWEVLAIVVGLALLALEVFVIPGFGVAGITGIVLVLFGFLMTFVPKEPNGTPGFLPSLDATWSALQTGLIVIVSAIFASLGLMIWLRKYMVKLPYFSRLVLTTPAGVFDASSAAAEPQWPPVGERGNAATDLRPGGSGQFIDPATGDKRFISVVSDSGFLRAGTPITVHEVGGGRVVVREVKESA